MGQGWRYTLRIPSWSQVQLTDGELVVFFQVEVTVLPPDDGAPRIRSVGRRYSNFVTLYQRLREEVGARMLAGLEPPPKRSFSGVNKKPELIERRRWELEQWLWRLTEVPQIANSAMMFHFCELDTASKMISRSRAPLSPSGSGLSASNKPSYAPSWSGSETSDLHEGAEGEVASSSTQPPGGSGATAPATAAAAAAAGARAAAPAGQPPPAHPHRSHSSHMHPQHQHLNRSPSGSIASAESAGGGALLVPAQSAPLPGLGPAPSSSGDTLAGLGGRVRLGLQIEQRAAIRGLARTLRSQLKTAASDLQDAVREIRGDQEAIAQLAAHVQQLEASLSALSAAEGSTSGPAMQRQQQQEEEEEEREQREGEAARSQLVELEGELQRERRRREAADAALAGARAAAAAWERELLQEREEAARRLEEALSRAPQAGQPAAEEQQEVAQQWQREAEQLEEQQVRLAELSRELEQRQAEAAELRQRLEGERVGQEAAHAAAAAAEAAAAKALADKDAAVAKSRADLKVLAREIKGLRQQLAAQEQQHSAMLAAQEQAAAAQPAAGALTAGELSAILAEVAALRGSLAECRVDVAVPPAALRQQELTKGAGAQAPLAQLQECSRRLHALKERTRRELLASCTGAEQADGAAPGEVPTAPGVPELRAAFGGLLLDAAESRRRYCELLRRCEEPALSAGGAEESAAGLARSTLAVSAHLEGLEQKVGVASPPRAQPLAPAPALGSPRPGAAAGPASPRAAAVASVAPRPELPPLVDLLDLGPAMPPIASPPGPADAVPAAAANGPAAGSEQEDTSLI